jgi:hypothetical protein
MSFVQAHRIRGYLYSSSAVTSKVPKGNILFAWPKTPDKLPCIIINQVAGSDIGFLGYKTSAAGSRNRRSTETYQIDTLSATSRKDTMDVGDAITPLLMVSGNYRKDADIDTYDDGLSAYRKIQTFTKNVINVQD